MERETSVFLYLTDRCNLTCAHCYVMSGPAATRGSMSLTVVHETLNVLEHLGVRDVRLIGGEPTVHPEFVAIIAELLDRGHRIRLISNGRRLYNETNLQRLLDSFESCWISVYGTTPNRHSEMAGPGAIDLQHIQRWVGELASGGCRIGLSVLLWPGDSAFIQEIMDTSLATGVRRLRLIPLEPDGRAQALSQDLWMRWPSELQVIYNILRGSMAASRFDVLTLNDPFDLGNRFLDGSCSCLLRSRRIPVIVPNGDVYSCCFNVFEGAHRIGNVLDPGIEDKLGTWRVANLGHPCRAFDSDYWKGASLGKLTCPIGAIPIRNVVEG